MSGGERRDPDTDAFLTRWSRHKRENRGGVRDDAQTSSSPPADYGEAAPDLTDQDLPPPESLDDDADFSGFLSPGVSEELRRRALSHLFASARFNLCDGLDDYAEDFTRFAGMGDLVTHEMRRMMDLERAGGGEDVEHEVRHQDADSMVSESEKGVSIEKKFPFSLSTGTQNGRARVAALAVAADADFQPTAAVSYRSRGRLLIVGFEERVRDAVLRLAPKLPSIIVLLPESAKLLDLSSPPGTNGGVHVEAFRATPKSISGYLGRFDVVLGGADGEIDLRDLTASTESHVDLVLDLSAQPFISSETAPLGYFAPRDDAAAYERALAEIPELVGEFEQPQYVLYDPDICAHARSGIVACTRCLDACSSDAIRVDGDRIAVDPNLCQGTGSCATACPSGALRYAYPRSRDLLATVKAMLRAYRDAGGQKSALLFHDAAAGRAQLERIAADVPDSLIPVEVDEIGSLGMDVWLAALAYGASGVTLLGSAQTTSMAVSEIDRQLAFARAFLDGMGYPNRALRFLADSDDGRLQQSLEGIEANMRVEPATFALFDDKRTMIHLALDHLHRHAPQPRPLVLLSTGAPFGEVWLNAERCTLCMACVSQCPGGALQAGDALPQLKFVEDNCVQCGLCARSCPENAIGPSPRYLFDDRQRRRVRTLKEEEPFCCIVCGEPFATRSLIGNIMTRLQGHPMYGPVELERLKMCEDCRVRALYELEQQTAVRQVEDTP